MCRRPLVEVAENPLTPVGGHRKRKLPIYGERFIPFDCLAPSGRVRNRWSANEWSSTHSLFSDTLLGVGIARVMPKVFQPFNRGYVSLTNPNKHSRGMVCAQGQSVQRHRMLERGPSLNLPLLRGRSRRKVFLPGNPGIIKWIIPPLGN